MTEWIIQYDKLIASITNLFVCASAVFVGFQAKYLYNDYKKKNTKAEFENSFKLTSFYINDIIPKMEAIYLAFSLAGIDKTISSKLEQKELEYFDEEEFTKIFDNVKVEDLINSINNLETIKLIKVVSIFSEYSICDLNLKYNTYIEKCSAGEKNFREELLATFWHNIAKVLNEFEYFAMYFNSNLAQSDVVYVSIHQTFTDCVRLLYPFFSQHNKRGNITRKYYTNVKELYIFWSKKESAFVQESKSALEAVDRKMGGNKKI